MEKAPSMQQTRCPSAVQYTPDTGAQLEKGYAGRKYGGLCHKVATCTALLSAVLVVQNSVWGFISHGYIVLQIPKSTRPMGNSGNE